VVLNKALTARSPRILSRNLGRNDRSAVRWRLRLSRGGITQSSISTKRFAGPSFRGFQRAEGHWFTRELSELMTFRPDRRFRSIPKQRGCPKNRLVLAAINGTFDPGS
jgi:hypothetical protein